MKLLSTTPRTIKAYLFYSFSWINMHAKTEDMCVTKLVGLVTRIPKHLDLYFFLFFYKFLGIFKVQPRNKSEGTEILRIGP